MSNLTTQSTEFSDCEPTVVRKIPHTVNRSCDEQSAGLAARHGVAELQSIRAGYAIETHVSFKAGQVGTTVMDSIEVYFAIVHERGASVCEVPTS